MEAIKKSLPAETGNFLQERLAQADAMEKEIEKLKKVVSEKEQEIKELDELASSYRKKLNAFDNIIQREKELKQNEADFEARKNSFEVKEIKYKLEEAEKRANVVTNIVKMVFHSPVYTESIVRNNSVNKYQNGMVNESEDENESIVVTKTKR